MKDSDELIACVLEALRSTEAAPGLEQRISERLRTQRSRSFRSRAWWHRPRWFTFSSRAISAGVFASIAGAALTIALVLAVTPNSHTHPGPMYTESSGQISMPSLVPKSKALTSESKATRPRSYKQGSSKQKRVLMQPITNANVAVMKQAYALNIPAPPLPLTVQEKLLIRVAHQGRPEEYAILSPERLAKEEAENRNAFVAFFEPLPPTKTAN